MHAVCNAECSKMNIKKKKNSQKILSKNFKNEFVYVSYSKTYRDCCTQSEHCKRETTERSPNVFFGFLKSIAFVAFFLHYTHHQISPEKKCFFFSVSLATAYCNDYKLVLLNILFLVVTDLDIIFYHMIFDEKEDMMHLHERNFAKNAFRFLKTETQTVIHLFSMYVN